MSDHDAPPEPTYVDTSDPWGYDDEFVSDRPFDPMRYADSERVRDISGEIPHPLTDAIGRWGSYRPWQPPRLWTVLAALTMSVLAVPWLAGSDEPSIEPSIEPASAVTAASETVGQDATVPPGADIATSEDVGPESESAVADEAATAFGVSTAGIARFGGVNNASFGDGSVPVNPAAESTMLDTAMCSAAKVGDDHGPRCGLGWSAQPLVGQLDERSAVIFAGFDNAIHVVDAQSKADLRAPYEMDAAVVGALALDPDGFPLIYAGAENGVLSVLATDRGHDLTPLWSFDLRSQTDGLWSTSWSGAPLIIEDHLIAGAGNGRLYSFRLNRTRADDGSVSVNPTLEHSLQTWNDDLLSTLPDRRVSVTGGVLVVGSTLYTANEGGRVLGWNVSDLLTSGEPKPVFRWTAPDAISAPMTADAAGALYIPVARLRRDSADTLVGGLVKLDPRSTSPVVWSSAGDPDDPAGSLSIPLVVGEIVVSTTENGVIAAFDRSTGAPVWSLQAAGPLRSSPIVQNKMLLVGDCAGTVSAFALDSVPPTKAWSARAGGCIESTPTVWGGSIYVGTSDGFVHRLADRPTE